MEDNRGRRMRGSQIGWRAEGEGEESECRGARFGWSSLTAEFVILVVPDHIELQIRYCAVAYEDSPAISIHKHNEPLAPLMSATSKTPLGR